MAAFANSLALGVTTLELDTHLTEDGKIIVWHDDTIQPGKCIDTAQPTEGDPKLPYVDDRLAELSLAQVKTLNCGFTQPPGYAEQEIIEDNRIPELNDVYQLARDHKANQVRFNIETLNTKAEMERLIDLGVDDIITDFPTRLRALMEKRWLKLPEAAPNS